jgi:hypothetical protein
VAKCDEFEHRSLAAGKRVCFQPRRQRHKLYLVLNDHVRESICEVVGPLGLDLSLVGVNLIAKVLALTGVLVDGRTREDDPIDVDGRTLRFRYDVRWDPRPASWVAVEQVGEPFDESTRTARFLSFDDFRRAYRALHSENPRRQDVDHWAV